jgi:poly [ADP-ribose] polymerase 6/8
MDALHPLLRPLLSWIMSSNRAHLRKLEHSERTDLVHTEHQFVLASSSPEKEARFRLLKSQVHRENKGKAQAPSSVHAWHGSGIQNWHAILRSGLKNYSNTPHMTAGAAYGPGIYMAIDFGTSAGYSGAGGYGHSGGHSSGWPNSAFQSPYFFIVRLQRSNIHDAPRAHPFITL